MSLSDPDPWCFRPAHPVQQRSQSSRRPRTFAAHTSTLPSNTPSSSSGSPSRTVNTSPSLLTQQLGMCDASSAHQPPPPQYFPMIAEVLESCASPYQRKEIFVHELQRLQRYPIKQSDRDTSTPEWISQLKRVIWDQEMEIARTERAPEQGHIAGAPQPPPRYVPMITDIFNAFPDPRQRKEIFLNDLRRLERYPIRQNERDGTTAQWISQLKQVIQEQEIEMQKMDMIPEEDKQMAVAFAQKMAISSPAADMGTGGAGSAATASSQNTSAVRALLGFGGSCDVGREVERPAIGRMANIATTRTDSASSGDAARPPAGPSINRIIPSASSGRPPRVPSIEKDPRRNHSAELGAARSSSGRLSTGKRCLDEQAVGPSTGRNIRRDETAGATNRSTQPVSENDVRRAMCFRTDQERVALRTPSQSGFGSRNEEGSRPVDERPFSSAPRQRLNTPRLSARKMKRKSQ
ncbi:hypothetical protein EPUS_01160 [Endocarpon pusillum Z07020]|uniref:Uncharacterized protein n=1 Tax=Endocarpon pusillum (strain Z07020 / HMAS-L-300199) TaxID=1263415 RepID=U1GB17_ENDPU|nr:uncharacterized protein EPUS_01160 [Endocarpon pusillum Z07020]ERF69203.1 hypothetical protein EPUS_01160 [Endocarpon pusillum Z07020]